jgi:hypothetical protein
MTIDPRDLGPEEIEDALDLALSNAEICEDADHPVVEKDYRNLLALATMAARMLEAGPDSYVVEVRDLKRGQPEWKEYMRLDGKDRMRRYRTLNDLSIEQEARARPLYAFPEPLAYPEPGETDG